MNFDWSDLAFGSKKPLSSLQATFVAAPRELSAARIAELVKTYLPKGNIVLGLAKEKFVDGLENQPQFATLQLPAVQGMVDKVRRAKTPHRVYTLSYFQRELPYVLEKVDYKRAVFVNGSWYRAFHLRPEFYALIKRGMPYELVSPFVSENEARDYAQRIKLSTMPTSGLYTEADMLALADQAATHSFAYSEFQTASTLGRKKGNKYELLAGAHNQIVPYETHAMHHGAAREAHFSPPNDLNYYDALHAEMCLLLKAHERKIDLAGTTLFINLLPCPTCARMLSQTDISEVVYRQDHSDGYAVKLFKQTDKTVRRVV